MDIEFDTRALKSLRRLQPKLAARFRRRLVAIAADPFARHANVEPIHGESHAFRLRIGDWRAVYRVDIDRQRVQVIRIAPRGDVYR